VAWKPLDGHVSLSNGKQQHGMQQGDGHATTQIKLSKKQLESAQF
jgi:hypothetical protein